MNSTVAVAKKDSANRNSDDFRGIELRPYQVAAIDGVRDAIRAGYKRPVMVAPTGAGKSVIFAEIIRRVVESGKRCLWLVHRRNLVLQFDEMLREKYNINAGLIMSGVESKTDRPVQLATVQTLSRRIKLPTSRFRVPADVVMVDEGHHAVSPTYTKILDNYDEKIIIGCTATPCRLDDRPLGDVYNQIVDVVGVEELTKAGYLCPARYFVPFTINIKGVRKTAGDYNKKDLVRIVNTKKICGDVLENWLKSAEDRRTLIFAVDVKHSIALRDEFVSAGINAHHLDARSSDEEREETMRQFVDGDVRVITSVMLYNEGLDVPGIECVVIVRPTMSLGLYRQMVGRGLRPFENKKDVLIFDHGGCRDRHGPVDAPTKWTLEGKKRAWEKNVAGEKTVTELICSFCDEVFIGQRECPRCGTELKTFGKKIEARPAVMKEIGPAKNRATIEDKAAIMAGLKWHCEKNNYSIGWASHAYKDYFGVWPNRSTIKDVSPCEPEGKTKNIIKHILIKKAMRYKKKKGEKK